MRTSFNGEGFAGEGIETELFLHTATLDAITHSCCFDLVSNLKRSYQGGVSAVGLVPASQIWRDNKLSVFLWPEVIFGNGEIEFKRIWPQIEGFDSECAIF
jgi:hypothetical protein